MEKKVIVIDEYNKSEFENAMNEALNKGFIPCGHPAIKFEDNSGDPIVLRFVVVMIKVNDQIAATLL